VASPQASPPVPFDRAAQPKRSEPVKLLLTVAEAARLLGIGRTLMYELINTGAVASVQVGRLRRIRPTDLESYAANLTPTAVSAIAA
jgi:excisionase family DNA binding protein